MPRYVALLRAVNVGDRQVAMAALKEMHEALGLVKVSTHLQTGNVIFECDETNAAQLEARLEKEFETRFGFRSEFMLRTAAELQEIFNKNPFANQPKRQTKWLVVMFLSDRPDEAAQQKLLSAYNGPEEMVVIDRELYIYYPEGIGRSKLTNALIEKHLKVAGTGRNWNTVTKLLEKINS
jgi:uncharacterized protein (DUF1697 family)